jgi:hypothetical protein
MESSVDKRNRGLAAPVFATRKTTTTIAKMVQAWANMDISFFY